MLRVSCSLRYTKRPSCFGPTRPRPWGGGKTDPFSEASPLKPEYIGKTVADLLIYRSSNGVINSGTKQAGAHVCLTTSNADPVARTRYRSNNFPWYAFPSELRDRKIEEIYHRGHVLKEKRAIHAFDMIQGI